MPRYDDTWIAEMLSQQRAALAPPEALLAAAGVGPGVTVVDVGCGPGFFSLPAARLVGATGRVLALDVEPRMLAFVAERAAREGLHNLTTVLVSSTAIDLPDSCAGVVVCSLVLHDLPPTERAGLASELARLCHQGGAVLIIEWQPRPADTRTNRLSPEATTTLLVDAGLRVTQTIHLGEFARPDGMAEGLYQVVGRCAPSSAQR